MIPLPGKQQEGRQNSSKPWPICMLVKGFTESIPTVSIEST